MGSYHVHWTATIRAPIEVVFERITDHESMRDWPGVADCRLIQEGAPRNGVGAVRQVRVRGLTLNEAIVHYEPPVRYDYSIVKGLPVIHRGSVTLEEHGGATTLTWTIDMSSHVPLFARVVGWQLKAALPKVLAYFTRETERAAADQAGG